MLARHALTLANRIIASENRHARRGLHFLLGLPLVGSALERLHYRVVMGSVPVPGPSEGALPVPPPRLRYAVTSTDGLLNADEFLATGAEHAALIRDAAGGALPSTVLELGCGVGRVLAHLQEPGVELYGCDLNREAIMWCRAHLAGDYQVTKLHPPLPYADATFGLVYAISVFTHLPEGLQREWIAELHRITRPDGLVLVTTHGEPTTSLLTAAELRRFRTGELVVRGGLVAGSNRCVVYHPPDYLRRVTDGLFDVVSTEVGAMRGQDLVTLRPA